MQWLQRSNGGCCGITCAVALPSRASHATSHTIVGVAVCCAAATVLRTLFAHEGLATEVAHVLCVCTCTVECTHAVVDTAMRADASDSIAAENARIAPKAATDRKRHISAPVQCYNDIHACTHGVMSQQLATDIV